MRLRALGFTVVVMALALTSACSTHHEQPQPTQSSKSTALPTRKADWTWVGKICSLLTEVGVAGETPLYGYRFERVGNQGPTKVSCQLAGQPSEPAYKGVDAKIAISEIVAEPTVQRTLEARRKWLDDNGYKNRDGICPYDTECWFKGSDGRTSSEILAFYYPYEIHVSYALPATLPLKEESRRIEAIDDGSVRLLWETIERLTP